MLIWEIIVFAIFVGIVMWYWHTPKSFKVLPEKKYPDNYSKHPDPTIYKKYR